jgi:UDP-GlcNAc:undecaprenyl-phosphate GlcNAc-1-phosphate transferase
MILLLTFMLSLILTGLIIITGHYHKRFSNDTDTKSEQKYHTVPTPRIGGLPILFSFILGFAIIKFHGISGIGYARAVLIPLIIIFTAGFLEDITKSITPLERTLFFVIALIIAIYLTHSMAIIDAAGYASIDRVIFIFPYLGIILTFFCVIGLTNAYNIIDGYHGLAAITALFNLLGLMGLEYIIHHDAGSMGIMLAFFGALLGFLIYNYPFGKIFLGDGGAYMTGFIIAITSMKMVHLHSPQVSPYAILLMAIYPVTELGFSIYRKKFLRNTSPTKPDGLHFHMLVYKRCTRFKSNNRNSQVVIIMLWLIVPQIGFAILFREYSTYCLLLILAYVVMYVYFYFCIVRFKAPAIFKFMLYSNK